MYLGLSIENSVINAAILNNGGDFVWQAPDKPSPAMKVVLALQNTTPLPALLISIIVFLVACLLVKNYGTVPTALLVQVVLPR